MLFWRKLIKQFGNVAFLTSLFLRNFIMTRLFVQILKTRKTLNFPREKTMIWKQKYNHARFYLFWMRPSESKIQSLNLSIAFKFTFDRLKGCICYIFASFFWCINKSSCKTRKNAFNFTLKALVVLGVIKFYLTSTQLLWWHQMPKHGTFYLINWEVSTVLQ